MNPKTRRNNSHLSNDLGDDASLYLGGFVHDFGSRQRRDAGGGDFERSKSALLWMMGAAPRASERASPRQGNSTRFIYADGEWRMAPDSNEINSTLTHRTLAARTVLLDYT